MDTKTEQSRMILIAPPRKGLLEGFTSGLICLANYLKSHASNMDIEIVDMGLEDALTSKLDFLQPDRISRTFIGITTTTATYYAAIQLAKRIKEICPDYIIILGGHHAGPEAETIFKHHGAIIDVVVDGEGEKSLLGIVKNFPHLEKVPNVIFQKGNEIVRNKIPAPLLTIAELDALPIRFENTSISEVQGKFDNITYVSARGCPLKCSFCAVANQTIRSKSIQQICNDITELVMLGASHITIEDNFFAHNRKRTIELCAALARLQKNGTKFSWDCQSRVESLIREDVVQVLEDAGCTAVYVGLEALTEDNLLYLGKATNPQIYFKRFWEKMLPIVLDSNLELFLNLQLGLPNDSANGQKRRLKDLAKIGREAITSSKIITIFPQLFVTYPGTRHFHQNVKTGLFSEDIFEKFVIWEEQEQPIKKWLGETFAHGIGGVPLGIMEQKDLRNGEFNIDLSKVNNIKSELAKWQKIDGIEVFQYGKHLAQ